jgi:hypothetical protein
LPFGFSRQQISKTLGFVKVNPAIGKGAAGKFPSLSHAQSSYAAESCFYAAHYGSTAMQMQFNQILASGRIGPGK